MIHFCKISIFLGSLLLLSSCQEKTADPVETLLAQMTLEEKLGQLNQLNTRSSIEKLYADVRAGNVGSVLNETDPKRLNQLQRLAVEESRLGIPILFARDVIHGFKTISPIPLGQAASFNPEIVRKCARVAAKEASSVGIRWTFAPMVDIARDPRWGRIAESLGEDTYLTSVLGCAMVAGFQGDSLNHPSSIAACVKHFAGYGAAEGGRDYNSTFLGERILRDVYLPPFQKAIESGAATLMTSFQDNDGIPSSGNEFLLKTILRKEWGFPGVVVSDWESVGEMVEHGFCENDREAAYEAMSAGVDMEMVSKTYITYLPELIREGRISVAQIDESVRRILKLKYQLGLFDHPYAPEVSSFYTPENLQTAYEAALQSAVLLKNKCNILPLKDFKGKIALIGPLADAPHDQMGTWVFDGEKQHTRTLRQAFASHFGSNVLYSAGLRYSRQTDRAGFADALEKARKSDVVVLVLGEESVLSGEAHSLSDLSLQGAQTELLKAIAQTGKPIITLVMAGRPLNIENEYELSDAFFYLFHPGTMGGPAVLDLLIGKETPSAKLPVTLPYSEGQIPFYYSHRNTGRPALEQETLLRDIPEDSKQTSLGCRSFYLDSGTKPFFPFGYGLSYTEFEYADPMVNDTVLQKNDTLCFSFKLTNKGTSAGTEIAQLYVRDPVASVTRPVRELKRFERIFLKPGETKTIRWKLPVAEWGFYNREMKYTTEKGAFTLFVGSDSEAQLSRDIYIQ